MPLLPRRANAGNTASETSAACGEFALGHGLPHIDRIQAAFGAHDVSHVQAHVGGAGSETAAAEAGTTAAAPQVGATTAGGASAGDETTEQDAGRRQAVARRAQGHRRQGPLRVHASITAPGETRAIAEADIAWTQASFWGARARTSAWAMSARTTRPRRRPKVSARRFRRAASRERARMCGVSAVVSSCRPTAFRSSRPS